jgi:hypothetical protein
MKKRTITQGILAALALAVSPVVGWSDEVDPLSLQGSPSPSTPPSTPSAKFFIEASAGHTAQRYGLPSQTPARVTLDFAQSIKFGNDWRGTFSNRLDYVSPTDAGQPSSVNNLRELFVSRRLTAGSAALEIGRINLRNGPAYGYNPTDFFRSGSIRSATSDDPIALRENRLGTVMLHYQLLAPDGSTSIAIAPKISSRPTDSGFDPDFGSTNNTNRLLLSFSTKISGSTSGQALLYVAERKGTQLGLNMTSLISDSAVVHLELTRGRDALAFELATVPQPRRTIRNRATLGATYTAPTSTSLTIEYEYNGFAPDAAQWSALARESADQIAKYLGSAQRQQDNAARRSWLAYVTQRDAGIKNLDISAFVRLNPDDDSRLTWVELRYHWTNFDGALQWRAGTGSGLTEFGLQPKRETVQLLGTWYF